MAVQTEIPSEMEPQPAARGLARKFVARLASIAILLTTVLLAYNFVGLVGTILVACILGISLACAFSALRGRRSTSDLRVTETGGPDPISLADGLVGSIDGRTAAVPAGACGPAPDRPWTYGCTGFE